MKTIICLSGMILLLSGTLRAQNPGVIRVKGGPNWQRSVPLGERYRYPQFKNGKITYTSGQTATGRLNYNILIGEMQFIDIKGDTLSLANETTVREVEVGESRFRYDPKFGFIEVISEHPAASLTMKPVFKTVRAEKNGGYNQSSGTSAISQYKSFIGSNGQLSRLEQEGDLLLEKDVVYLMVDRNNRFYRLNRATVLKTFPKSRSEIDAFLKAESIDFKKEADLKKLLQFCSSLSNY
ncbi:hypothetical protein [Larkinella soli]|uniref:hypothetical protein n=1 Tax=Larkinella soli TaxID=1770527 RepID=UPI000FFC1295|nr:hypothetical protein [Larkinella soli]